MLTLALGLTVNATVFSLVNDFFLRPLPAKNPEQLVIIALSSAALFDMSYTFSLPDLKDYAELTNVFSGIIGSQVTPACLTLDGHSEWIYGQIATANFSRAAVAILALGIAANTTLLSWVSGTLLDPIPRETRRGAGLLLKGEWTARATPPFSYDDYRDLSRSNRSFSGLLAFHDDVVTLTGGGRDSEFEARWRPSTTSTCWVCGRSSVAASCRRKTKPRAPRRSSSSATRCGRTASAEIRPLLARLTDPPPSLHDRRRGAGGLPGLPARRAVGLSGCRS